MCTKVTVIAIAALCALSTVPANAATVHFSGTDSTTQIASVFNRKSLYLNLHDAAAKLRLTVIWDSASGLLILSSPQDCVPVFERDQDEVQIKDKELFVRTDEVSSALGCKAALKGKNDLTLACPSGLPAGTVGNQAGDPAPGFRLHSDTATVVSLAERLKQRPMLVVFFRNGEWDPFSKLLLTMLQSRLDSIHALGYDVVAIHGYEPKSAVKWSKDLNVTFPLLADQYSAVIRAYNVLESAHLAAPSLFAIDQHGIIRLRHVFDLNGPPDLSPILKELKK